MDFMESNSKKLDDLFFIKEDQKLMEHLKTMKKLKETADALAQVSGIKNRQILEKLVKLNVRPETLASLSLIPLVEVAWADGSVDEKEKIAVLSAAEKMGFAKNSSDYEILSQWMNHRPSKELLDAWIDYMKGLCAELSKEEIGSLRNELMSNTRMIASASGGVMGIGSISKTENKILKVLEDSFC